MATRKRTRRAPHVKTSLRKTVSARRPEQEQIDAGRMPEDDVDASPDGPAAILERFCSALAVISTATAAMDASQDRIIVKEIADDSDMIYALRRGLDDLKQVYNELDLAILKGDV